MARKKLKRFSELETMPNVLDRDEASLGGAWVEAHLGVRRPLALELCCGKGEYTLALARRRPDWHVIGIDRRGDRLWKGARQALAEGLGNVLFLRAEIRDVGLYFAPEQVHQIWLPFPDPMPKRRHAKHRVFSRPYLEIYRRLLSPGGSLHLKSDDPGLAAEFQEAVQSLGGHFLAWIEDVHAADLDGLPDADLVRVVTTFERRHLAAGKTIFYAAVEFPEEAP
ncbi:MAG: tRNA (guanosine(46)-N7)-methyltransferase TrmB [Acidobacteriota bacterium]